jgi:2-polyprenyl-3-methyl-5-hydroxy-6-metoxy-1,4-benzoquinol methylase
MTIHASELNSGERFAFGANWAKFLEQLDDQRIAQAEESIRSMLNVQNLAGQRLLDIGSGSGLFSLAARRLGAAVHSFDFDPQSVACTRKLRERHDSKDAGWTVEEGSVLDDAYMAQLGQFQLVYSWGVLHHTGQMWHAVRNAADRVAVGGRFFIALYNDQGRRSAMWLKTKRAYNATPRALRWLILAPAFVRLWGPTTLLDFMRGQPFATWRGVKKVRGMDPWRDVVDWVGGLPFEVASPDEVLELLRPLGFVLVRLKTCGGGHGCNEYVLERQHA